MKQDNPKISVITVVRNGEKVLEQTMLSILNQTYKNIEYIIIDGSSKDGTLNIIKKYESKIKKEEFPNVSFTYISEDDMGIYDAMNKGINRASGEWINFMNAGDIFFSNDVLNCIFNGGNKFDISISVLYGDTVYLNYDKRLLYKKPKKLHNFWKGMCFGHQACFVRTYLMRQYGFDITYKLAADYKLLFTLFNDGFGFLYVPISITIFSIEGISDHNYKSIKERIDIISKTHNNIIHRIFYTYLLYSNFARYYFMKYIGKKNYALLRRAKWKIKHLIN